MWSRAVVNAVKLPDSYNSCAYTTYRATDVAKVVQYYSIRSDGDDCRDAVLYPPADVIDVRYPPAVDRGGGGPYIPWRLVTPHRHDFGKIVGELEFCF